MTAPPVHLRPEPAGSDPQMITWRVGPGLVRVTGAVTPDLAPGPVQELLRGGVLDSVYVAPGRIDTRLAAGHTPATDGAGIRSALFAALSEPGGWPDETDPAGPDSAGAAVAVAADREIAEAVQKVLDGEFSSYTSSHGGMVTLLGVTDGLVQVRLGGACNGCAFADNTIRNNLIARLSPIPGFAGVVVSGDTDCSSEPRRARAHLAFPRIGRSPGKSGR